MLEHSGKNKTFRKQHRQTPNLFSINDANYNNRCELCCPIASGCISFFPSVDFSRNSNSSTLYHKSIVQEHVMHEM